MQRLWRILVASLLAGTVFLPSSLSARPTSSSNSDNSARSASRPSQADEIKVGAKLGGGFVSIDDHEYDVTNLTAFLVMEGRIQDFLYEVNLGAVRIGIDYERSSPVSYINTHHRDYLGLALLLKKELVSDMPVLGSLAVGSGIDWRNLVREVGVGDFPEAESTVTYRLPLAVQFNGIGGFEASSLTAEFRMHLDLVSDPAVTEFVYLAGMMF